MVAKTLNFSQIIKKIQNLKILIYGPRFWQVVNLAGAQMMYSEVVWRHDVRFSSKLQGMFLSSISCLCESLEWIACSEGKIWLIPFLKEMYGNLWKSDTCQVKTPRIFWSTVPMVMKTSHIAYININRWKSNHNGHQKFIFSGFAGKNVKGNANLHYPPPR